jgi:prepilin-type N-terminal cleavage/methylation domain-containing protein
MERRNNSERGYNLVEVLIAMAILGTVIMSILTLFIFGRRNVYSGRQMTRATSVSTHVIEDLIPLDIENFYTAFAITPTTTIAASNTVAGVAYPDSIIRRVGNFTPPAAPARNYFASWMALLQADRIQGGQITLVIMPRERDVAAEPTSARVLIIRSVTEWREGGRARQVALDITKLNRKIF